MFWHAGFPILVIAYALTKDRRIGDETGARTAVLGAVVMTLGAAAALTLLAAAAQDALPALMRENHDSAGDGRRDFDVRALSLFALLALVASPPPLFRARPLAYCRDLRLAV